MSKKQSTTVQKKVINQYESRTGEDWKPEEEALLFELKAIQGLPYSIISLELKRTSESCKSKWRRTTWETKPFYDNTRVRIKQNMKVALAQRISDANDRRISVRHMATEILADRIEDAVVALPNVKKEVYKFSKKSAQQKHLPEDVGLVLSDAHIGHHHSLSETGGISEYNFEIFKKRVEFLKTAITDIVELHSQLYSLPNLHIFCPGDIVAGMNAAGNWSSTYINMPIVDQAVAGTDAISDMIYYWLGLFENINFYGVYGNHGRCNSEQTRALTPCGYKYYTELNEGDLIGTLNTSTGTFEFLPIQKIHVFNSDNTLVNIKTNVCDIKCTEDHDVLVRSRGKQKKFRKVKAGDLLQSKSTSYSIPISCKSGKQDFNHSDFNISDDMLKLIGYVMTDGRYSVVGLGVTIYQSKTRNIKNIINMLNRLNIEYSESVRKRDVKEIFGKEIKKCRDEHGFYLKPYNANVRDLRMLLPEKNIIPSWMYNLSDKQMMILLESIVDGDGSRRKPVTGKDGYKRSGGLDVVWGEKGFLESLAGLLISHDISCSINKHKRSVDMVRKDGSKQISYYLQIRKNKNYRFAKKDVIKQPYKGKTWCVTVKNGTIAVLGEYGDLYFTGNCASKGVEKEYVNWDYVCYKFLKERFSDNSRVNFVVPDAWWLMETIRNHKFLLLHGDNARNIKSLEAVSERMASITGCIPNYTIAGHFHTATDFSTNFGRVILNGSFVGGDIYSLKELVRSSRPVQKMFGIHDKRGITWTYDLDLSIAR